MADSGMGMEDDDDMDDFSDDEDDLPMQDDMGSMDDEEEPTTMSMPAPTRGMSSAEKINNELMNVNTEIGRMLDTYKQDKDMAKYKQSASPLLAKRKELEAKLNDVFNLEDDDQDIATADMNSEDPYAF